MNKKKGCLAGCFGCLGIIILFSLLFAACGAIFSDDSDKEATGTKVTNTAVDEQKKDESQAEKQKAEQDEKEKAEAEAKQEAEEKKVSEEEAKKKATKTDGTTNRIAVTLTKTVDGDTIKVNYNGQEETIRYLLVDTPETKDPNSCVQPYGTDAYNRNKQLVNSGKLEIEFDVGERKDKYGRLLAYVYVNGKSVQETLLKEGLARVAYVYPPNTRYLNQFQSAEASAKNNGTAIWSQSGYATEDGFNGCVKKKQTTRDSDEDSKSSNSSSSTDSSPSQSSSNNSSSTPSSGGTEIFKNCTELRTKYPNGVPSSHPAYQSKMDRDKDNYACER
ncbi:thermonuclease family protein [Bacillus gobiensis]|uniref:thermonuclease family protein n=1 Tax=Bacillus gobiensis TaxID=1441095 RepID=UPI003D19D383